VRDQIRDKLAYAFEDLGEQSVKNIARPVRVYALRPDAVADLPAPSVPPARPISQAAIVPRLPIVVLPFANLGNHPEQQYFADGITEDLTTDLSYPTTTTKFATSSAEEVLTAHIRSCWCGGAPSNGGTISRTSPRRRPCGSGARRTGSNSARPDVTLLLSTDCLPWRRGSEW
jgi:hypothetical protein